MLGHFLVPCLLALLLAGCAPTILRVETDPPGADVESAQLGYLGTTPLERILNAADVKKVGSGGTVAMDIKISKRDYVSVDLRNVSFPVASTFPLKKSLEKRLAEIQISTDPPGASVYQLILDADAPDAVKQLFAKDPLQASNDHARWVTQRFVGQSTTKYVYDSEHPLEHNDTLLFLMAGYHPSVAYFKANQEQMHLVMRPLVAEAR